MSIYRAFMQCFKWPGRLGTGNVFLKSKNKLKFICNFFKFVYMPVLALCVAKKASMLALMRVSVV